MRKTIKELLMDLTQGTEVLVSGWVKTRRDSKSGVSFLNISDGSCFQSLQVVIPDSVDNYHSEILRLTTGCSVQVIGTLVDSQGKGQQIEVQAKEVKVLGWVSNPETYPIAAKRHTLEHLRDHLHLRIRTNTIGSVMRIRHVISMAIHRFFDQNNFFWVHTPIITSSDCEGAGEMFRVSTLDLTKVSQNYSKDFFGKECFLTVSGQLNVESYCEALGRVYTFGPTFRAENSNTSRHLAEFWMVEPEIAFADLDDNARLATELLKYVAKIVLLESKEEMMFFEKYIDQQCINRLENILNSEFINLDYQEAIKLLLDSKYSFEVPVVYGMDLQSEHERFLTEQIIKQPVILKNYPKEIKSFYMRVNDDQKTVAAMDILVPGIGEIIGGSQREERLDVLENRMRELNMDLSLYQWYLDLRRYGSVYHAGFGLGLERLIMYVTGMNNIRDVIPFPRFPKHADF